MKKSVCAFCLFFLFAGSCSFLFSAGKRDITLREVENMESWQEQFDINEKKAGKYNIYVEAKDKGGNTEIAGPYNLFIDPDSDYPISGITNPVKDMRVPGNLNIVGTCIDDDGVAEVWLVLDGAEPVKAEGTEFWSYYLDTNNLAEGPHTIEVWGVDVNGLSSQEKPEKKSFVTWNLDRRQPVTQVTSHGLGELVSGKIELKGTVGDGNGIKRLYYSLDNGENFSETKISVDKKSGLCTFSLAIDTRKYEDGPAIVWFKAFDKMNSVGVYSYLYFIDNTKPDVQIVSPADGEVCNGRFAVAGYAKDKVGLQKLSWSFNGQSGDFELVPGNPYWLKEVDTRGVKGKSADFVITAVDTAGNIVELKKSIPLDQEADKPVVAVSAPESGSVVSGEPGTLFLRGIVSDDDGVASIAYSVDGSEPVFLETAGVFCAELAAEEQLSIGVHTITVTATDIHGVKGNPVTVSFSAMGALPQFSPAKIGGLPVTNGILVHPESNPVFETAVSSRSGIASLRYKIECGENEIFEEVVQVSKTPEKNLSLRIPLASAPWGLLRVTVSAEDIYGRVAEQKSLIHLKDLTYIHEDLLDVPLSERIIEGTDENGSLDVSIVSIGGAEYKGGMNVIVPYGAAGMPVVAVIDVATEEEKGVSVSYVIEGDNEVGGDVRQSGKADFVDGHYEIKLQNLPSRITTITVRAEAGKTASGSCTGTFCVVRPVPARRSGWTSGNVYWFPNETAAFDANRNAYIVKSGAEITGYADVPAPIHVSVSDERLDVSNDGKSISVTAASDGTYRDVSLIVRDGNGKTYQSAGITIVVDSSAPELSIVSPANHSWAQNSAQIVVSASDSNGIARVAFSRNNGETWTDMVARAGTYTADISLAGDEDGFIPIDVRAVDSVGKTTVQSIAIQKDATPPDVSIIFPEREDIVNGDNLIAFSVRDNGRLAGAQYIAPPKKGSVSAPVELELAPLISTHVGTPEQPIDDLMAFRFTDAVGNATEIRQWDFIIDNGSDLPIAEVYVPEENAVLTRDFEFSGVIFDDDGVMKDENGQVIAGPRIYYKFDDGQYHELDQIGTNFAIQSRLTDFTDNEHSITVYAVDINGVKGPEYVRNFRISLEEPKGEVSAPPISETVKGTVEIAGTATDKNGIKAVYISVDNGNTFNEAIGNYGNEMTVCNWKYEFDTRVVQDGTHVVFMKVVDWYGIEGLYSSMINSDNTNPQIELELPLDDSTTTGMVFFSGQTTDNIGLTKLYITIRSLEGKIVSTKLARTDLVPDEIITQAIDLRSLDNGFYNVELTGMDAADNVTRVSRNIQLDKNAAKAKVDLLYPLNGEYVQGVFNIYGTAVSESDIRLLSLFVDDKKVAETQLSESGYYKFTVDPTLIADGRHDIRVEAHLADASKILSNVQYLNYRSVGPWVTIDNFTYGDFAVERPYIIGNAGYTYDEEEVIRANAKGASKELKESLAAKTVQKVELSFDNGKSFTKVSSNGKWRYRVENEDIAEGYHFLLLRATMKNGETAVTRCIVQVDGTKPTIKLISPGAGGHYNQNMVFSGLAHDNVALKSLTLALRKGDKSAYEVPAFIQGLYFDWQFWGATLFNVGAGLTFFDDNVKLQVQWGQFTQEQRNLFNKSSLRYGGSNIFGVKLLANVYYLPFRYYFGPDWEWLSANVSVGANFTRFNESGSGKAQILSAALVQLEFPRVTFSRQKMFRTIAFYTEGQLWFIPTDVSSSGQDVDSLVPQISFGLRVNVF